jgi:transcriptional/translational regulatory protein YebC/TACO1
MADPSWWANTRYFLNLRALCSARQTGAPGPGIVRLEGYTPGGAAILIDCHSADPGRSRAQLRGAFAACGGHLGADGSVGYLFQQVAVLIYPPGSNVSTLRRAALAAGAEEVVIHPEACVEVLTDPAECTTVRRLLARGGQEPAIVDITWRAARAHPLSGAAAQSTIELLDDLSARDEVYALYSNAQLPQEMLPSGP